MPLIHLTTFIQAPVKRVFDLSRSIDFHTESMNHSYEIAVDGVMSGLINLDETVTWQARHLFKNRTLVSLITAMKPYQFFEDCMVSGDFKSLRHEHHFKQVSNGTIMIDLFYFEVPLGIVGQFFNFIYLKEYMEKLLAKRNEHLKQAAETNAWKKYLPEPVPL
ncbi:MAG: SRPBCC family protein [Chitinophagaceae bacterium]|nr:SRPBCC family protein [Chitinophagaceae bacterium]